MKNLLFLFVFLSSSFLFAQESIARNYLAEDDMTAAKNFQKQYSDDVITKNFTILKVNSTTNNKFNVEYKAYLKEDYVVVDIDYEFREKDFTILFKSLKFTDKTTGVTTNIKADSSVEVLKNYYDLVKKLFLTLQSDYISPISNK
jgi:hypothetical protein